MAAPPSKSKEEERDELYPDSFSLSPIGTIAVAIFAVLVILFISACDPPSTLQTELGEIIEDSLPPKKIDLADYSTQDEGSATAESLLPGNRLIQVAELNSPPSNLAVTKSGRLFFTFHPFTAPFTKVAEWIPEYHGYAPFPNQDFQSPEAGGFDTVFSVRIDSLNRLWVLDYGNDGKGKVRLFAFDLETNQLVHTFDFRKEIAPTGSLFNDFQISPDAKFIYIADTSIQGNHPALVLYDIENGVARRVLENFPAVRAVADRPLVIGDEVVFPHLTGKIHVDSIGLDKQGVWLYFAALLKEELYRVRVSELWRQDLAPRELSEKVEMYSKKPVADGITLDTEDNIYLTDIENSAITVITKEKKVVTLVQDEKRLRWPDGVGFDAEGYLYIACSDLHKVSDLGEAPFQIFKIKPGLVEGAQVAGQ